MRRRSRDRIRVLVDEFDTALVVGRAEVDDWKIRSRNRTDERRLRVRSRSRSILDRPRRFSDHRRHDQELGAPGPQHVRAVTVTWLVGVGCSEQDARCRQATTSSGAACEPALRGLAPCCAQFKRLGAARVARTDECLERVLARQLRVEHLSGELLRGHVAPRRLGPESLGYVIGERHPNGHRHQCTGEGTCSRRIDAAHEERHALALFASAVLVRGSRPVAGRGGCELGRV